MDPAGRAMSIEPAPENFGQALSVESFGPNILDSGPPEVRVIPVKVRSEAVVEISGWFQASTSAKPSAWLAAVRTKMM